MAYEFGRVTGRQAGGRGDRKRDLDEFDVRRRGRWTPEQGMVIDPNRERRTAQPKQQPNPLPNEPEPIAQPAQEPIQTESTGYDIQITFTDADGVTNHWLTDYHLRIFISSILTVSLFLKIAMIIANPTAASAAATAITKNTNSCPVTSPK